MRFLCVFSLCHVKQFKGTLDEIRAWSFAQKPLNCFHLHISFHVWAFHLQYLTRATLTLDESVSVFGSQPLLPVGSNTSHAMCLPRAPLLLTVQGWLADSAYQKGILKDVKRCEILLPKHVWITASARTISGLESRRQWDAAGCSGMQWDAVGPWTCQIGGKRQRENVMPIVTVSYYSHHESSGILWYLVCLHTWNICGYWFWKEVATDWHGWTERHNIGTLTFQQSLSDFL